MTRYDNVNTDGYLQQYECYSEIPSGAKYFKHDNQKYYWIGDYLSFGNIVRAFKFSGHTGNFVHMWSY